MTVRWPSAAAARAASRQAGLQVTAVGGRRSLRIGSGGRLEQIMPRSVILAIQIESVVSGYGAVACAALYSSQSTRVIPAGGPALSAVAAAQCAAALGRPPAPGNRLGQAGRRAGQVRSCWCPSGRQRRQGVDETEDGGSAWFRSASRLIAWWRVACGRLRSTVPFVRVLWLLIGVQQ